MAFEEREIQIEFIMKKYISEINFKWNSDVFPSSSIAKVVLDVLGESGTMFRIIHTTVRNILRKWEGLNYCKCISMTHYANCKRTKAVYQFNDVGLLYFTS